MNIITSFSFSFPYTGLLNDLFVELYENYVILGGTFIKWRDSKDQSAGKGKNKHHKVAAKIINCFFSFCFRRSCC